MLFKSIIYKINIKNLSVFLFIFLYIYLLKISGYSEIKSILYNGVTSKGPIIPL